jgi:O-antigen ligase
LLVFLALKRPFNYLVAAGTAILAAVGGWWLFSTGVLEEAGSATITLSGRVEIWSRAIYGLQDFPFTGMGMNMFREVVHLLYPLFTISPTTDLGHAHNHLLQAGVDLGIPGLIAYLSLWFGSAFLLWQGWQKTNDRYLRTLIAGLSATLLAHFTYGIVDAIALGARPNFLLWMIFGLVVAVHHHAAVLAQKKPSNSDGSLD